MNIFLSFLTIFFYSSCFCQLKKSYADSVILSTFTFNSSLKSVVHEFGKGEKIESYYTKKRIIPKRYPKNAVGCGTAIWRYRHFRSKKTKKYFDEVIYFKSPFHVFLFFENDSLKTIKVIDTSLCFDNNVKIGDTLCFLPQDELIENNCIISYQTNGNILNSVIYSNDNYIIQTVIKRRKREYRIS